MGGSRARVGTRRNQAGTRLKSANLPYQKPFSPDPPHLLNIILFKRWGDQRKGACRPAEVSPSRILKGGLSRPRAEAVLYKRAGFCVEEAHPAPGRSESVQTGSLLCRGSPFGPGPKRTCTKGQASASRKPIQRLGATESISRKGKSKALARTGPRSFPALQFQRKIWIVSRIERLHQGSNCIASRTERAGPSRKRCQPVTRP